MIGALLSLCLAAPAAEVEVAAVHYLGTDASRVNRACKPSEYRCAIEHLVRRAAARGAKLVVTPEYAFSQRAPEPDPKLGPLSPKIESEAELLARFADLARELSVHLVINLVTKEGDRRYNTQVVFGPEGRVLGKHHKFELFAAERHTFQRGDDVSVVDTPFGRVGLLICADIYGDPHLHAKLTEELGARIVAISSWWTVPDARAWLAAFARDWGVFVVAVNGNDGLGGGSGVFGPDGAALAVSKGSRPEVLVATIPRPPAPRAGAAGAPAR